MRGLGDFDQVRGKAVLDVVSLVADTFSRSLADEYRRSYGSSAGRLSEGVDAAARLAIERIGTSNAPYHNFEHTMLVTGVGWDILRGKRLHKKIDAEDAAHFLLACLLHDIGYVRGICSGDVGAVVTINEAGDVIEWPRGASDAFLTPYHVDRSKLFIRERLSNDDLLDAERIARAVELTRFPVPDDADHQETDTEAGLVRAADLIGQLGDPYYLKKRFALFQEFQEIGANERLGYSSPADLVEKYPKFFWSHTYPYIKPAIKYLDCTASGREWIAHLFRHVFAAEHVAELSS